MVMRYGSRIWKLRVMQAEIKMTIRLMYCFASVLTSFFNYDTRFHLKQLLGLVVAAAASAVAVEVIATNLQCLWSCTTSYIICISVMVISLCISWILVTSCREDVTR